ncbi:hypothetical protein L670_04060 [Escherichia coli NCTC 50110]|nr:hypothetical protein C201_08739 [Escherichia coli S17]KGL71428.1 hypothetical protein L670_04060 [Escherichia coli NCTC 50110]
MRCAYQAYKLNCNLLNLHIFVGRIRRLRRIRQHKAQFVSNVLPRHRRGFFLPGIYL